MYQMDSLPDRPLRVHEIRLINEGSNSIQNAEALYYLDNNVNAVVCMMINMNSTANILVYKPDEEEWIVFSTMGSDSSSEVYNEESDSVVEWMEEMYGEDGFGVYGYDDVPDN